MKRFRVTPSIVPNLFTAMNMFCGFYSIISSAQQDFRTAGWLIIAAAIFDALDGAMARLTRSSSELGVELDSLSDVVSFGAAPSFLIYSVHLFQFEAIGVIIASLPLISGGFRLARFNIELVGFNKEFFIGLPIPLSAITIVSFILGFYSNGFEKFYSEVTIPLIILLSFLMVSRIKYDTIPKFSIRAIKRKPIPFIFLLVSAVVVAFFAMKGLFFIFVFMILFGIFRHLIKLLKAENNDF